MRHFRYFLLFLAISGSLLAQSGARVSGKPIVFTAGDTTPSVRKGSYFQTNNSSAAVTITKFEGMSTGDIFMVEVADDSTSVEDGTYIDWPGDISMTFLTGDLFQCKESAGVAQCWIVRLK